jgi:hypothetical protein
MGRILAIIFGVLLIIFIVFLGLRLREDRGPLLQFGGQSGDLNVNLEEIKPAQWLPYTNDQINGLVRVNIDSRWVDGELVDAEDEWLFFYQYDLSADQSTSQLGGVIYDAQNRPRGNDSIAIPDQSSAYLVPYRLLPDYHLPKTNGYLGNDSLDYKQIAVRIKGSTESAPVYDRLLVRGQYRNQINRYSIFWWLDDRLGYGAAYATTPGWFSLSRLNPSDWEAWNTGTYIQTLWAWEPENNRSNLCRREKWQLTESEYPEFVAQSAVDPTFAKYGGDLTFCNGQIPIEPAFPEAQVLAYLEDGDARRLVAEPRTAIPSYREVEVFALSAPKILNDGDPPVVQVDVDFNSNEGWRTMTWTVLMIPPETIKQAIEWRIVAAEDR